MPRSVVIKARLTPEEKYRIEQKAQAAGLTLSDFMRQLMLKAQLRKSAEAKEQLYQLAKIGNNLNQLARWAHLHKANMEAVEILLYLEAIWHELRKNNACI